MAGFLYDEDNHAKGNSKMDTAGNIELEMTHSRMIVTDLLAGIREETLIILYEQSPRQLEWNYNKELVPS